MFSTAKDGAGEMLRFIPSNVVVDDPADRSIVVARTPMIAVVRGNSDIRTFRLAGRSSARECPGVPGSARSAGWLNHVLLPSSPTAIARTRRAHSGHAAGIVNRDSTRDSTRVNARDSPRVSAGSEAATGRLCTPQGQAGTASAIEVARPTWIMPNPDACHARDTLRW